MNASDVNLLALGFAAIITAIATLIGTLVQGAKTREDIRNMHQQLNHEVTPNHGASLRDSMNRIEQNLSVHTEALERVEKHQRGMARDIGRLADADAEIQSQAFQSHQRFEDRIIALERCRRDEHN